MFRVLKFNLQHNKSLLMGHFNLNAGNTVCHFMTHFEPMTDLQRAPCVVIFTTYNCNLQSKQIDSVKLVTFTSL